MKNFFRNLKYLHMILMQIIVIIAVITLFRIIPDRKIASVFASLLFIMLSASLCYAEAIKPHKWKNPLFITAGFFLYFIAIPMAIVRFSNWQTDFTQLKIWWIEGSDFHKIANYFFMSMTLANVWNLVTNKKT